jgi:Flp pilus assembly pilin Flp
MTIIRELFADETGASMADYAVLLALVSVACMAAVQALSDQIAVVVTTTASTLGGVHN